jgi:hypothetical protein
MALNNAEYLNYYDKNTGLFKGCISDDFTIIYDDLLENSEFQENIPSTIILIENPNHQEDKKYIECIIAKFTTGDVPGYRISELIFGGELKANIGDSLTSVLDKIKNKFTNFEYFYDVDGKFIF